jgi:hypothetical protein
MIRATMLVKDPGPLPASRHAGESDFMQLPSPGDHIQIRNKRGKTSLLEVICVQHTPRAVSSDWPERGIVHVSCNLLGEYE